MAQVAYKLEMVEQMLGIFNLFVMWLTKRSIVTVGGRIRREPFSKPIFRAQLFSPYGLAPEVGSNARKVEASIVMCSGCAMSEIASESENGLGNHELPGLANKNKKAELGSMAMYPELQESLFNRGR